MVQRFGFHARPTTLVLTFDTELDALRAQNTANYQIVALDGPRHRIRIRRAVYDSATRTVTLSPAHRLSLQHRCRLTVIGTGQSGVTDRNGNLLDGLNNGDPGSDFATVITGKILVLPAMARRNARAPEQVMPGAAEMERQPERLAPG
jgi:hypothetical protein